MPDEHLLREIERIVRQVERIEEHVRNPSPPYVTREVYDEGRLRTGERIGVIEKDVAEIRAGNSKALWFAISALVSGIVVPIFFIILVTQLGIK